MRVHPPSPLGAWSSIGLLAGLFLCQLLPLLTPLVVVAADATNDDRTTNDEVNLSSYQIARLRGFQSENHYVTSEDGYVINVVRIFPVRSTQKARGKRPVIFNHGTTQSSTYFMTNSVGARPRDFTDTQAGSMNQSSLENLLANEPVAKCFPLLLACFGHDVWLINRRGTEFSLGRRRPSTAASGSSSSTSSAIMSALTSNPLASILANLTSSITALTFGGGDNSDNNDDDETLKQSRAADEIQSSIEDVGSFLRLLLRPQLNVGSLANTFDAGYWNFSLDEQAKYDLPAVINYVLEQSESEKVAYVGHSIGNGLMFMLQSEQPEWAQRVEPFLAWSPDFYLGHTTSILRPVLVGLQPVLMAASFPFPPTPIDPLTRTLLASLCQTQLAQETVCLLLEQAMWGFSGLQQQTLPAFVASQFYSVSSHEAAQLAQNSELGKMYHYDYGNPSANSRAYGGQTRPPIYNVSRIISKSISLWHGAKDALAEPEDVQLLKSDFNVPIDDRFITEVPFNHYDLLFGRNVTTLVNLPSLKLIESYNDD